MSAIPIVPILLCVDVEPDERLTRPAQPNPWNGFPAMVDSLEKFRLSMAERWGAPASFSWFFRIDEQITQTYGSSDWALTAYPAIISNLIQRGDETGLHVHAWKWNTDLSAWVADHADQDRIERQLREAFIKFRTFFGFPCRSFRFGDHWMNHPTMSLLQELGVRYDVTVEPGRLPSATLNEGEYATGRLPDYRCALTQPYRMNPEDYLSSDPAGANNLWIIPASAGMNVPLSPTWIKRKMKKAFLSLNTKREKQPLNLSYTHPMAFRETVESYLKSSFPHLVLVSRTDAPLHARQSRWMDENLNYLLGHEYASQFRFVRPQTFIEIYERRQVGSCEPVLSGCK